MFFYLVVFCLVGGARGLVSDSIANICGTGWTCSWSVPKAADPGSKRTRAGAGLTSISFLS